MIKLNATDGGKVAAGFEHEYNDCAVRALAVSTGISYGDAHDMLRERPSGSETYNTVSGIRAMGQATAARK